MVEARPVVVVEGARTGLLVVGVGAWVEEVDGDGSVEELVVDGLSTGTTVPMALSGAVATWASGPAGEQPAKEAAAAQNTTVAAHRPVTCERLIRTASTSPRRSPLSVSPSDKPSQNASGRNPTSITRATRPELELHLAGYQDIEERTRVATAAGSLTTKSSGPSAASTRSRRRAPPERRLPPGSCTPTPVTAENSHDQARPRILRSILCGAKIKSCSSDDFMPLPTRRTAARLHGSRMLFGTSAQKPGN